MIVGVGNLSTHLLSILLTGENTSRLVVAGRHADSVVRRTNLARYTAANLGAVTEPQTVVVDLGDIDRTSEVIASFKPDLVFMGASLQAARMISELPADMYHAIDEAQFGLWLPMHLTLVYNLMQAVKQSGVSCKVINSAYPDAVGPVLHKIGLAPDIGVGNVGNIVPALCFSAASCLGVSPTQIDIKLVAQHYFSHYVHRFGDAGRGRYHMSVRLSDEVVGQELDHDEVFRRLVGEHKRVGGTAGQILTASSAARIISGLCCENPISAHAPSPLGLPGGYPVRIDRSNIALDLPADLSEQEAIAINEDCQLADGIERIGSDGTVIFAQREVDIMEKLLGYKCNQMKIAESAQWADELGRKYQEFVRRGVVPSRPGMTGAALAYASH
jgi:hypothetical protein